jgi:hypothetical protein
VYIFQNNRRFSFIHAVLQNYTRVHVRFCKIRREISLVWGFKGIRSIFHIFVTDRGGGALH